MKVMLDMDGVVAAFDKAAWRLMGQTPPCVYGWDFVPDHLWSMMNRQFWATLEKTPECDRIVAALAEAVGMDNICILSNPVNGGDTTECVAGKLDWIRLHLPQFRHRFLFGPDKSFCAHPHTILVDDSPKYVSRFVKAGGRAILVPRPYNLLHMFDTADWVEKRIVHLTSDIRREVHEHPWQSNPQGTLPEMREP